MEPLPVQKTIKVYQLLKLSTKNGMSLNVCGTVPGNSANYIGTGFYFSQSEAEQNRTLEVLKDTDGARFYVFELEIPNPAYTE
jgi:hypothetical protein